jgi:type VI secretion system protein ImpJ
MLLSPQHLQQWDRSVHHLVAERLRAAQPFEWGFTRLEIDRDALRNGRFALIAAAGVLPDGTPFAAPEEDPLPAARSLEGHLGPRQESLTVAIGLPAMRRGRAQLGDAAEAGTPGPRYSPETVELPDDNDGANERGIELARPNLCLLFPDEALGDHDLLAVAEVVRTAEGGFGLRESFVPPCLWIGASPRLVGLLGSLRDILLQKGSDLAEKRSQRGSIADFAAGDAYAFWLLHSVDAAIPFLAHALNHRRTHPESAYLMLAGLAGQLCAFSAAVQPRDLPAYDHRAPGSTFEKLNTVLRDLLERPEPSRVVRIELEKKDGLYVGKIVDERVLSPAASLFLGARAELDEAQLIQDLPAKIKIASRDRIDLLIAGALPGVQVRHNRVPPASLPKRADMLYFEIHPAGSEWEGIKGAKTLAIFLPNVPGLSLELVGLRE